MVPTAPDPHFTLLASVPAEAGGHRRHAVQKLASMASYPNEVNSADHVPQTPHRLTHSPSRSIPLDRFADPLADGETTPA
jgi:hypothetical protein